MYTKNTVPVFTKKETDVCKGIAIILMLFHHLFNDFEEYAGYTVSYWPFTDERIHFFALLSKICVAVFVFLSGYGIAATYQKQFETQEPSPQELRIFVMSRYKKLMASYWFVFVLTLLCQPLGRTVFDAYGHSIKEILLYFLVDFFGLSYLLETPTLNPTWWYMSLALCIILLAPFIIRLMKRCGAVLVLCASMAFLFLTKLLNPSTFYLFSLLLGITCFETGFFEKLSKAVQDSRLKVTGLSIVEILGFLLLLSYRSRYNFNGIADGLIALSLACMVQTFLSRIKLLSNILRKLGEHSANMFLTHNQIYSFYFPGFFYSFKHWSIILLSLVLVTFLLSVLMEAVKEKLHYDRLIGKIFQ